ncbi:Penicillin-binding protein 1C [Sulfitobacter noctilucicola]|uniref:peptidoglycan glycosyltransferase n=1 Tax=Sulfitobacter noctilucicola TaxID=1342301 RepID=A0A7W6M4S9_9RHOB|nr:penicillin-binding protein 1C [Sulfitobacter noctilucicola]KIN63048.1 Penicillin-binding protein 1C [Sulfitobacter noctilucicola]MBB4172425.1 penicillin-binding protein 1C [Sulfitobacter noctilucicola]
MRRLAPFILVTLLWSGAALRDRVDQWIDHTVLPPMYADTSVEVRDRDGDLLRIFAVEGGRVRLAVEPELVDPEFVSMLIAYEDKRFYAHNGVDLRAAIRAAIQALMAGEIVSGGSTLTMQVARLLENSGTGRWTGKLRQVRLALALERRLTKSDILKLYLLHAPYGGPVEGVRAGALAWFGKEPSRLNKAEAALLVALPQSPETRRPDRHPDAARKARDRVLARVGSPAPIYHAALPRRMRPFVRLAPHLTDLVRNSDPLTRYHDLTLDAGLQRQVEDIATRAMSRQTRGVSVSIVVAEHQTGTVLASVGSGSYSAHNGALGFVDMTRAKRSPGSTLKPFIYGLAFDQGLVHPESLIDDIPTSFGRYAPQNFDGVFRGAVTVREALQLSLNIPPLLLLDELGPTRLMALMRKGGAQPALPGGAAGLAIGLGGIGISLNDLVQLYGGLAQGGQVFELRHNMKSGISTPRRIMTRKAAWQVSHILAGMPAPAGYATPSQKDIGYKTGTSYGHRDAWAIGFDGKHVVGVWLGRPDGTPVPGAFGGEMAAPLMFEAFARLGSRPVALPPPPAETLLLSTNQLPVPLQRFRSRTAAFDKAPDSPHVRFPPDQAILKLGDEGVPLKIASGTLPLSVIVDGVPVLTGLRHRETLLPLTEQGFSRISVVDAQGRSASVGIELR